MLRAETALARFTGIMAPYPLHSVRACATHAVRTATNREEFRQRVKGLTGLTIEVLSGEEEARLALLGALSALPEERRRYPLLLVDVGGGSSEVVLQATAGSAARMISLPLGAVGLTEEFGADREAMREKIRATLTPALRGIAERSCSGKIPCWWLPAGQRPAWPLLPWGWTAMMPSRSRITP